MIVVVEVVMVMAVVGSGGGDGGGDMNVYEQSSVPQFSLDSSREWNTTTLMLSLTGSMGHKGVDTDLSPAYLCVLAFHV